MTEYSENLAADLGHVLTDLSAKDPGMPLSREWIEDVIASPWHDQLLAYDGEELVGTATLSIVMGAHLGRYQDGPRAGIGKNAYLEDFVVSHQHQGKGIGKILWQEMLVWGREKGARRLEFTSSGSDKKTGAVGFYLKMGAQVHGTNFFRIEL